MLFIFQGSSAPSYLSTFLLESWHRSIGEQKYIAIKRFALFYEGYNYMVFESNAAIKRLILLIIAQSLPLCIFYRHLSLGFDVNEMGATNQCLSF